MTCRSSRPLYEYNADSELTRVIYPEGNSVEYVYDDANP